MGESDLPCIVKGNRRSLAVVSILVLLMVCVGAIWVGADMGTMVVLLALTCGLLAALWFSSHVHQVKLQMDRICFRNTLLEYKEVPYREIKRIEVKKTNSIKGGTQYKIELVLSPLDDVAEGFPLSPPFSRKECALIIDTLARYSRAPLDQLATQIRSGEIKL
jgi:hypothetical protein